MDIKEKIGKRIKELRKENNISQEALANISNIDRTYIQSIEQGERNISIKILEKIAKGFKISLSELLKDI